jgi:hypothetical protein
VSDEGVPPRQKVVGKFLKDLLLCGPIEVDDYVAAENYIRFFGHPIFGILEIQAPEFD